MVSIENIYHRLKPGILETGAFIKREGLHFDQNHIEKKGFNDLVSYVDKEAEKKLVRYCEEACPEAGFITEEGTSYGQKETYNWIIDPLDGTTNFTHGLPIFSISVALMRKGQLVLGIVYEINKNELFHAVENSPAFLNDQVIQVSNISSLDDSLLATGFPYYDFNQMENYLSILNDFMKATHGLRRLGSAAVDLAYVACGRFEGFFEYNLNAWDVAAGAFIVRQAGGKLTDFRGGEDYIFGREIIAGGDIQPDMLSIIQKRWTNQER